MDKLKKANLDSLGNYLEVSSWIAYLKSFLEGVSYKLAGDCAYTRSELLSKHRVLNLLLEAPSDLNIDPIMYLLSLGEIKVYTLEDLIKQYPQTVTYVVDRNLNYKGCTFLLSGRVDLTEEQKANMTAEEIELYELGEMQWDWTIPDIFVDTHSKSIVSLGLKYESVCYDLEPRVCFCIDNIAKRMYQKAVETGEWLNTVYEDEMTPVEEVKLKTQEVECFIIPDGN